MFYYKKEQSGYYIWGDKNKGKFGPFSGIFVKNKFFGVEKKFSENIELKKIQKKYSGYKFAFGIGKEKFFIISENGIEKIV